MTKIVRESLNELKENWVSTDTGVNLYAPNVKYDSPDLEMETDSKMEDSILSIIPPSNLKFDSESFSQYVDELIQALPKNPGLVYLIFSKTLEKHPYLTVKPIGFTSKNLYQPIIYKFKKALDKFNPETPI